MLIAVDATTVNFEPALRTIGCEGNDKKVISTEIQFLLFVAPSRFDVLLEAQRPAPSKVTSAFMRVFIYTWYLVKAPSCHHVSVVERSARLRRERITYENKNVGRHTIHPTVNTR